MKIKMVNLNGPFKLVVKISIINETFMTLHLLEHICCNTFEGFFMQLDVGVTWMKF